MNQGIYRLVFNQARGLLMVVGELATHRGKNTQSGVMGSSASLSGASRSQSSSQCFTLSPLRFALVLALGQVTLSSTAFADILIDRSAPADQRATVLNSANGVPQVNIQTPTAAGVSRNQYTQFDVDNNGAILNNSRHNVSTQLGGMVSGNPNLIGGTARVIVNQVNSTNPSLMNGFVEVAGSRAQVVFSNPAGISCSGCGFINAHRATLTTGTPVYNNGDLDSYRVEGGTVTINGTGLDASSTEFTHIIARSVEVNAGIWANDLTVVTGTNDVAASTNADVSERSSASATAPSVAIDVSALGGMYANKIHLVGTEDGVGVRHAGAIGAGVGGFTLSADGRVENMGQINSTANVAINTRGDVDNTGTVYAGEDATITSASTINQTGIVAAYDQVSLTAQGQIISDATSLTVAGIDDQGVFKDPATQTTASTITATAQGNIDLQGQQVALDNLNVTGQNITLDNNEQDATRIDMIAVDGDITVSHSTSLATQFSAQGQSVAITDSQQAFTQASITATQNTIDLTGTTLSTEAQLSLNAAQTLVTDSADVTAETLTLSAASLSNRSGQLLHSGTDSTRIDLAGDLDNTSGRLESNGALSLTATTVLNQSGRLISASNLTVSSDETLNNQQGEIISGAQLTMESGVDTATGSGITSGALNNDQGLIQSAGSAYIDTHDHALINTHSGNTDGIVSGDTLTIHASTINNDAGYVGADQALTITTTGDSSNQTGVIESAANVTLDTAALDNDQGRIQSGAGLTIDTNGQTLTNTQSGADGGVISGDTLAITASSFDNTTGYIGASADLAITTTSDSSNQSGTIESQSTLRVTSGALDNDQGTIRSLSDLTVSTAVGSSLTNTQSSETGGIRSGGALTVTTDHLDNTEGTLSSVTHFIVTTRGVITNLLGDIGSAASLTINSQALNNDQGRIQSNGEMVIDTNDHTLTNTNSGSDNGIIGQSDVTFTTGDLNNQSGYIGSAGALEATSASIDNSQHGQFVSAAQLQLTGSTLDNSIGQIQSTDALTIDVGTGQLTNTEGLIRSGDHADITAGSLLNNTTQGADQGLEADSLSVTASTTINNTDGAIRTNESLILAAATTINNTRGLVSSANHNVILQDTDLANNNLAVTNTDGTLIAGQTLDIDSHSLTGDGNLYSEGDIDIQLASTYTHTGDLIANGTAKLHTTGNIDHQSTMAAGQLLDLQAATIDTQAGSTFDATSLKLNATDSNTFNNRSVINGTNVDIDTITLNNLGTGRIYGDTITLAADTINNHAEDGQAPVIAARNELDIGVGSLSNTGGALIYSDGDLSIGGAITAGQATGSATTVTNDQSIIEAVGALDITANTINNLGGEVETTTQSTTESAVSFSINAFNNTHYDASQVSTYTSEVLFASTPGGTSDHVFRFDVTRTTTQDVISRTDPASIRSGQGMSLTGTVNNTNSDITAGGTLTQTGVLNNSSDTGTQRVSEAGTFTEYYRIKHKGADNQGAETYSYSGPNNLHQPEVYLATSTTPDDGESGEQFPGITDITRIESRYETIEVDNGEGGTDVRRVQYFDAYGLQQIEGDPITTTINLESSVFRGNTNATEGFIIDPNAAQSLSETAAGSTTPTANTRDVEISSAANISITPSTPTTTAVEQRQLAQFTEITNNTGAVRSSNAIATPSNNSLFSQDPAPTATYLIETDPLFTDNRTWLSSAYVTQQITLHPDVVNKRMGDGFYEQRLVRNQIVALTGRRFLGNYSDDDTQYQDLLDSGIAFAQAHSLRPGLSLSAEQMADITTDMVWLEAQDVQIADGSTQQVLVPKLYAVVQPNDLLPSGALLSGDSIDIQGDELVNSGQLIARTRIDIDAGTLTDTGGRLQTAAATINATTDATLAGSDWRLTDDLNITAGRDIAIRSLSDTVEYPNNSQNNNQSNSSAVTTAGRRATITVGNGSNASTFNILAGRNASLTGATINNQGTGDTTLRADNDLTLDTVIETTDIASTHARGKSVTRSSQNEITSTINGQGNVNLQAGNGLQIRGGDVTAAQALTLDADNIRLTTAENRANSRVASNNKQTEARDLNHDGVNLQAGTDLTLDALKDLAATSASATAGNDIALNAGGDIDLTVAQDERYRYEKTENKKSWGRKTTTIKESFTTTNVGGQFEAGNNLTINSTINPDNSVTANAASGDVTIVGSDLSAENQVAIAGDSVTIADKKEVTFTREETFKRGFGGLNSRHAGQTSRAVLADSSDVTANTQDLDLISSKDLTITGSNVIAGQETRLDAGGDVTIESATNTMIDTSFDHKSKFGFSMNGLSVSLGETKEKTDTTTTTIQQSGSTIGSLNGNVTITAKDTATIAASDVITRGGDITVEADNVAIESRDNTVNGETVHSVEYTGVTVALSGGAADSINTAIASTERTQSTDNDALQALHTWKAANALSDLNNQLDGLGEGLGNDFANPTEKTPEGQKSANIDLSVSLGTNKSESRQQFTQTTALGSTLSAGGAITITAKGDQANNTNSGDIRSTGSYISGDNVSLDAQDEVILASAENTTDSNTTQESSSASVGVSIGASGLNFTVSASKSEGFTHQSEDRYLESQVIGNNTVNISSGNDTTLEGAQVRGEQITANVGGDLNIISQQDQSQFEQENKSISGSLTVGTSPSGSLSMSELQANANYQAVQEQSGLFAGEQGFDVTVNNNTDLQGGVIVSTTDDTTKNTLSTDTLTASTIRNVSEYDIESTSVSVSGGANGPTLNTPAYAEDSDKQENTTYSAISEGSIDIRSGNTTALANVKDSEAEAHTVLENNFNQDLVQDVEDQAEANQLAAQMGSQAVGDYAKRQVDAANDLRARANTLDSNDPEEARRLRTQADQLTSDWGEGGRLRVAAHTALGALTGGIEGALGSGATAALVPELDKALAAAGVPDNARAAILLTTSAGIGAITNGTEGAIHSAGQTQHNYLKHAEAMRLAELERNKNNKEFSPEEREAMREEIAELRALDKERDRIADSACQIVSSPECGNVMLELTQFNQDYIDAGVVTRPRSAPYTVRQELGEVANRLRTTSDNLRNESIYNIEQGVKQFVSNSIEEGVDGALVIYDTLMGLQRLDPEAMERVASVYGAVDEFTDAPIDNTVKVSQAIATEWQDIQTDLESPDPVIRAQAEQRQAKFTAEVLTTLTGVAAVGRSLSGEIAQFADEAGKLAQEGKKLIDNTLDTRSATGDRTFDQGNTDGQLVGQPNLIPPKSFSENRQLTAGEINQAHSNDFGTDFIPYQNGTVTTERFLQPGEKFYSIEYAQQSGPGGWATPKKYNSIEEARRELALLPEFKNNSVGGGLVLREYTVKKIAPVREGKVGELKSENGNLYEGGGDQIEFLFDRGNMDNQKWKEFLEEPKTYKIGKVKNE